MLHYISRIMVIVVTLNKRFLGRHSLMAGLRILIQFFGRKKPLPPFFESKCPFFHLHHFHSHHLSGVTRSHQGSPGITRVHQGSPGGDWGRPAWHCLALLGTSGHQQALVGTGWTARRRWVWLGGAGRHWPGDVGLQTFKQVLNNKLQLNITQFTNHRPKMATFSLKTFRLFLTQNDVILLSN